MKFFDGSLVLNLKGGWIFLFLKNIKKKAVCLSFLVSVTVRTLRVSEEKRKEIPKRVKNESSGAD